MSRHRCPTAFPICPPAALRPPRHLRYQQMRCPSTGGGFITIHGWTGWCKRRYAPIPMCASPPPTWSGRRQPCVKLKRQPAYRPAQIGRAHVRTQVTSAHLVCRLLLEKKKKTTNATATNNRDVPLLSTIV